MSKHDKKKPHAAKDKRTVSFLAKVASQRWTPPTLAVLYAIILFVAAFTYHKIGDYGEETDFYWTYAPHAQSILEGKVGVDPFKGPGYEFALAFVGIFVKDLFQAGTLIAVASAALVLFFSYKTIGKLFGSQTALIVCLALATNFTFLKYSYSSGTDMFFNMLAALVLYFLLRTDSLRLWEMAIAGALTGYAYMTRYNAVSFYLAATAGLLFLNYKRVDWRKRLLSISIFILASSLFVVPWGLYCMRETGSFFYNKNFLNIAFEMFGKGKVSWDEYWHAVAPKFHSYLDVMRADPVSFFGQIGENLGEHFWNDVTLLIGLPLGIFSVPGIIMFLLQRVHRSQGMYFIFCGAFFLVLLPVFYGERFSLYLAPMFLVSAISFFGWKKIPALGFPRFGVKQIILLGLLFWSGYLSVERARKDIDAGPKEVLLVRDSFFRNPPTDGAIKGVVARKPHIAYYLKMKMIPFPYVNSFEKLLEECKKAGASYLFYSGIEAALRPEFSYLLEPRRAPRQLRPLVHVPYPPAVLYELHFE